LGSRERRPAPGEGEILRQHLVIHLSDEQQVLLPSLHNHAWPRQSFGSATFAATGSPSSERRNRTRARTSGSSRPRLRLGPEPSSGSRCRVKALLSMRLKCCTTSSNVILLPSCMYGLVRGKARSVGVL